MNHRTVLQSRLQAIVCGIDPAAMVQHVLDEGVFIVSAPNRRDVPLSEEFVADRLDREIEEEIRRRWSASDGEEHPF